MPIDWRFQLGLRLPVHRISGALHTGIDFKPTRHAGYSTRGNDLLRPSHRSPIFVWDYGVRPVMDTESSTSKLSCLAPWWNLV